MFFDMATPNLGTSLSMQTFLVAGHSASLHLGLLRFWLCARSSRRSTAALAALEERIGEADLLAMHMPPQLLTKFNTVGKYAVLETKNFV